MSDYDLIVIGSGPAGQKAAIQAAKLGKKVALIERRKYIGGVSVHTGTIPSKTMREAAIYLTGWNQRGLYGSDYCLNPHLTMADLMERVNITLGHQSELMRQQVERNNIEIIQGIARFQTPHSIELETEDGQFSELSADYFVIAAGSRPKRPDNIEFNNKTILDSDGILQIENIPKSLVVVGGGVIGIEYASIFSALDTQVTIIDGRDSLLGFMDEKLVDALTGYMQQHGIKIHLGEKIRDLRQQDDNIRICLESGLCLDTEMILFAAGRMGSTYDLRPRHVGIETDDRRLIIVNEHYQTNFPHIYACGDVIGFPGLASTAMEQGRIAANHAFGRETNALPGRFPFGIYSIPEMSMVGQTEQALKKQGIPYITGTALLKETARGQIMGLREGMLRLLFRADNHHLLGVHILGEGATELIHIGQAVINLQGTIHYFIENVFNYPTLAEAYKIAALDAMNQINSQ
ncbi:MAG: Si-specific NAD(P)(+) transhydrogenase [Gammaproteobacteria bacterium]|nr:Si-specific NAD(P)(+) transhydrogenase [Gammaproteobacteria bacterium]